jgi:DNA-binding response OmpR family regulator
MDAAGMIADDPGNRVILADNDVLLRGVIRSVLLHAGQQVFVAADGPEALDLARQFTARLVLLDIAMPRLNGLLTCKAIRKLPGYEAVPIVMLTGFDDERMREAAKQVRANDFITKPFRPDTLLSRLAGFLGLSGERESARAAAFHSRADQASGRALVWERFHETTHGDDLPSSSGRETMRIHRDAERKR